MSDLYPVPDDARARALIDKARYDERYQRSVEDNEGFWAEQAQRIDWIRPFTQVKDVLIREGRFAYPLVPGRHSERLLQLH